MSRTVYARVFFSRSWSTIQHWLPEIGEFSVHAIGLSTIEAQFEVLFFQFVCGLAPRLQRLLPRSQFPLCAHAPSVFPPGRSAQLQAPAASLY